MKYKTQHIKAQHLRAGYKVLNKQGNPVKIASIKRIDNTYLIKFVTGAEVVLYKDETLPVTFNAKR